MKKLRNIRRTQRTLFAHPFRARLDLAKTVPSAVEVCPRGRLPFSLGCSALNQSQSPILSFSAINFLIQESHVVRALLPRDYAPIKSNLFLLLHFPLYFISYSWKKLLRKSQNKRIAIYLPSQKLSMPSQWCMKGELPSLRRRP